MDEWIPSCEEEIRRGVFWGGVLLVVVMEGNWSR